MAGVRNDDYWGTEIAFLERFQKISLRQEEWCLQKRFFILNFRVLEENEV